MASDTQRAMREKAKRVETTFALTAGLSPNPDREGRLAVARMSCPSRHLRLHKHGWNVRHIVCFVLLVEDRIGIGRLMQHVVGVLVPE